MTQQDDITRRLRDNADLDEAEHGNARLVQLERDAADEIERLRAELSQVRAPVADEQFKAAFPNGVLTAARFHELWESAGHNPNPDRTLLENLAWQVGKFAGLVAKEASPPVADERATKALNRIERRASDDGRQRDIDDLAVVRAALASAPVAVPVTPDLQVQIVALRRPDWPSTGDRSSFHEGYETARVDILRLLRRSAPVAGEAVYTLRVRGVIRAWTPTAAAFSIPDGEHQL
ncbi:hypothetical protein ACOTC4_32965, partial [Achromobacter xylosoxidans]